MKRSIANVPAGLNGPHLPPISFSITITVIIITIIMAITITTIIGQAHGWMKMAVDMSEVSN
jgi:hypothetical protein